MNIIYYFLKNVKTGEQIQDISLGYYGGIGDRVAIKGNIYTIVDFAVERADQEIAEDF